MTKLEPIEMRTWRAFLGAHARIVPTLDEELAREMGMSLSQYEVLLRLKDAPENAMRMTELAQTVIMSPSGITRTVDNLERRGFVERRVCASDRRGYLAVLTKAGHDRLRRASTVHMRGIREHFTEKLTHEQMEKLAEILEVLGSLETEPCEKAS